MSINMAPQQNRSTVRLPFASRTNFEHPAVLAENQRSAILG